MPQCDTGLFYYAAVVMTTLVAEADVCRELELVAALLTAERRSCDGFSQQKLAAALGVSANTVTEWESGRESLTLCHLVAWAWTFGLRVVIVDASGYELRYPLPREDDEAWGVYELRRLTGALRDVRRVRRGSVGSTQLDVARKAGVSRSSILNWETLVTPPQTLGLIRWAAALGFRIRLARLQPPHLILGV